MHFEVPKAKKFKEFGGEYVMIVISILTALALEQGFEYLHHRHLAHEAAAMMNVELRDDIKSVAGVLEVNEKKRRALTEAREQLLAGIRSKTSDAELMKRFEREWRPAMSLNLITPSLRREAWDAAVASQAVTWMPRETLERYAAAYSGIRDTSTMAYNGAMTFLDAPRLLDAASNTQMGVSNPQEIYRAMTHMVVAYQNFDDNLKTLNDVLQKVLDENGGGHAAKPAAH